jgi:hypothetical protein
VLFLFAVLFDFRAAGFGLLGVFGDFFENGFKDLKRYTKKNFDHLLASQLFDDFEDGYSDNQRSTRDCEWMFVNGME